MGNTLTPGYLYFDGLKFVTQVISSTLTGPAGGDLSGDYPNPSVVKLNGNPISAAIPSTGQVLEWNGSTWTPTTGSFFTAGGDLGGTSTNQTVIGIHGVPVSATSPTTGQVLEYNGSVWIPATLGTSFTAGGDLSGTSTVQHVISINGATVPAAGSLTDGYFLQVSGSSALTYGPVNSLQSNPVQAQSLGAGQSNFALVWNGTTWLAKNVFLSQSAGGDLGDFYPNPTVRALWNAAIPEVLPSNPGATTGFAIGNVLQVIDITANNQALGYGTLSLGTGVLSPNVNGILGASFQAPQFLSGDLSGNTNGTGSAYNSNSYGATVVALQNIPVEHTTLGLSQDGYVLTYVNSAGQWEPQPSTTGSSLAGDVTGATSSTSIAKLQGINLTASGGSAPSSGQFLKYNGSVWLPSSATVTLIDDVTGSSSVNANTATTVVAIQGNPILAQSLGSAQDGYVLTWINSAGKWEAIENAGGSGAFVAGGDLSGSSVDQTVIKINGTSVPASPSAHDVLIASNSTTSSWSLISDANVSGSASIAGSKIDTTTGGIVSIVASNTIQSAISVATTSVTIGGTYGTAPSITVGTGVPSSTPPDGSIFLRTDGDGSGTESIYSYEGSAWVPVGAAAAGVAGGDLSGFYPNPTVIAIQKNAVDNTLLSSTQDGYVLTWKNSSNEWKAEPASGSFTAGGDLSGTSTSQTVIAIHGNPVSGTSPTAGQFLIENNSATGSAWTSLSGDTTASISTVGKITVVALQGNAVEAQSLTSVDDGYVLTWHNSSSMWEALPVSGSFTAGGDLSGTSTNQTVEKIQGVIISGTPSTGWLIQATSPTAASWQAPPSGSFSAGGDLSGSSTVQTVIGLQGVSVSTTTPTNGYVLTYDSSTSKWEPQVGGGGGSGPVIQDSGSVGANIRLDTSLASPIDNTKDGIVNIGNFIDAAVSYTITDADFASGFTSDILITASQPITISQGSTIVISGVTGTTESNGTWNSIPFIIPVESVTNNGSGLIQIQTNSPSKQLSGNTVAISSVGLNITGASNNSGLIQIQTEFGNNFVTGDTITIYGVEGTTEANGTWIITNIGGSQFTLNGSTFVHTYTAGGQCNIGSDVINGTWAVSPVTASISNAQNNSGNIQITLSSVTTIIDGDTVIISGVTGTTEANGTWIVASANTFNDGLNFVLTGSTFTHTYSSGGNANFINEFILNSSSSGFAISNVNSATPVQITTLNPNTFVTGDYVNIAGVVGVNVNASAYQITVIDNQHFTLNSTTGSGTASIGYASYTYALSSPTYSAGGTFLGENNLLIPVTFVNPYISGGTITLRSGVYESYSNILGGDQNYIDGYYSVIGGGNQNSTSSKYTTIAGGYQNYIASGADYSVITGGFRNIINANGFNSSGNLNGEQNYYNSSGSNVINGGIGNIIGINSADNSDFCLVEGILNIVTGGSVYTHAEGSSNIITTDNTSHIEGSSNNCYANISCHIEGQSNNIQSNQYSHIEGYTNVSNSGGNFYVHIEGSTNTITGDYLTHIEGYQNSSTDDQYCHIEGQGNTTTSNTYIHLEGTNSSSITSNTGTHIEGSTHTVDSDNYSHIEGFDNFLDNTFHTHIEGEHCNAIGTTAAHAQGSGAVAVRNSQDAMASGSFASQGDAQVNNLVLRGVSAGTFTLGCDITTGTGSGTNLNLVASSTTIIVEAVAQDLTGINYASFQQIYLAYGTVGFMNVVPPTSFAPIISQAGNYNPLTDWTLTGTTDGTNFIITFAALTDPNSISCVANVRFIENSSL